MTLKKADKMEFSRYAKANMQRAYFTALGLLGNHDDAMELSQEAFLRAYKNFNKFERDKKFFTWYYKILRNLCLNFIRDRKNKKEVGLYEETTASIKVAPFEEIENKELGNLVQSALYELDENDREIIVLKEFQHLSYKEIAEVMDIPIGSVMSKLFYARKKLATKMKSRI